jgi:molybdopterin biosynthesis enzyme MoaB
MKPEYRYLMTLLAAVMLSSCANTKFTKQWVAEDFNQQPFDDILVLVVADKMGNRQDAENYIVEKLGEAGIDAMPSFDILPKTETIDREAVGKAIDGLQLDAVIVMYATGITEEEYFIPARRFGVYAGYGYGHAHYSSFYDYYPHAMTYVYIPGYDNTHYVVTLETSLFDLNTGNMIWSGQSNTFAPESVDDVIHNITVLTISELKKKSIIK